MANNGSYDLTIMIEQEDKRSISSYRKVWLAPAKGLCLAKECHSLAIRDSVTSFNTILRDLHHLYFQRSDEIRKKFNDAEFPALLRICTTYQIHKLLNIYLKEMYYLDFSRSTYDLIREKCGELEAMRYYGHSDTFNYHENIYAKSPKLWDSFFQLFKNSSFIFLWKKCLRFVSFETVTRMADQMNFAELGIYEIHSFKEIADEFELTSNQGLKCGYIVSMIRTNAKKRKEPFPRSMAYIKESEHPITNST